jgi:CRP-like cAMP-binding protein
MAENFEKPYCNLCAARVHSVLRDLPTDELKTVATTKASNFYRKGQIIFSEGSTPIGLFCIHAGKAKLFRTGDEGKDQIIRFAKGGDVLGYRSLLSGEPYSASAAAIEDSVVCCIPGATFFETLKKDGNFSMRLMQLLTGDLRNAQNQIVNLAQKPVRERLVETLLILKEIYGTENGDNSPINVKLSRDELAAVVGTATETLVRTLAELKKENLIATDKKKIRILDVRGLVRAGNLQD